VALADHDDVIARHLHRQEVMWPCDFRAMCDDRWDSPEDVVPLGGGDVGVGELASPEIRDVVEFVRRLIAQQIQRAADPVLAGKRCRHGASISDGVKVIGIRWQPRTWVEWKTG